MSSKSYNTNLINYNNEEFQFLKYFYLLQMHY